MRWPWAKSVNGLPVAESGGVREYMYELCTLENGIKEEKPKTYLILSLSLPISCLLLSSPIQISPASCAILPPWRLGRYNLVSRATIFPQIFFLRPSAALILSWH